jgi:hypothetical protein
MGIKPPTTTPTNDREFNKWCRDTDPDWMHRGSGSPEGVVTAPIGHLFLRSDGGATTTLYVKTSGTGATGWTAK